MLPIELARQANGFIDATKPFSLAKDPANNARLDAILNLSTRAVYTAFVALLPVLPDKADAALLQLNVSVVGRTLADLLAHPPAAGSTIGEGSPLFPRFDAK